MPVTIEGKTYELPTSFTLDELTIFKQNGGFTMQRIFEALEDMDPEAWKAMLYVMRRRAGDDVTLDDVGAMDFMDLTFTDTEGDAAEAGDVLPPGDAASAASDPSDETGSQETMLGVRGQVASLTPSDSSRGRWAS